MTAENTLIEVYTGLAWEVEMLKTILADHQIKSFVKDEYIGTIAPHYSGGAIGAVKLCILSGDMESAKPLIEEFVQNKTE
ncbi:putative signal transducing protein [Marinifilum caeruleilacunae]|uniref:DUF2007 domain-containing protein n=1 Tax=Marinifilum caeruleilacunae TaxID=2499076 RepID=A0ABX1X0I2_9BACT|nr:DUF2007 domain-containing protein [Marinifilum caeruleilacunae]NOU61809.1 hypothetical protein [Marinifilum caeruleilacunae]